MSTLIRDDGTPFVMQAYRELVTAEKKSIIAQRVRLLADQHGQYVRLFKKTHGKYEAAFSREGGYLLGETIKQYFGNSNNLIFCEAIPNSTDAILVIVRDGNVHLDTLLPAKNIRNELVPLTSSQEKYQIVISGSVPVKRYPEDAAFTLPSDLVQSFETLNAPLFPRLTPARSLYLVPLPVALKSERLTGRPTLITSILILVLIVLGFIYYPKPTPMKPAIHSAQKQKIDVYQTYYQAMMTPEPRVELLETLNLINTLYELPGWEATSVQFKDNQFQIDVASNGAGLQTLSAWAKENNFLFGLTDTTAILSLNSHSPTRSKPNTIYSEQTVLISIIDQLDQLLQGKRVQLHEVAHADGIKEMRVDIQLQDDSPRTLLLIGDTLNELPTSINYFNLMLKTGLISGTINLSVWGT